MAFLKTPEPFGCTGLSLQSPMTLIVEKEGSDTFSEIEIEYYNGASWASLGTFKATFVSKSGFNVAYFDVSTILAGAVKRVKTIEASNIVRQNFIDATNRFFKYRITETIQEEVFEGHVSYAGIQSLFEYYFNLDTTLPNKQSTYIDYVVTADDIPDLPPAYELVDYNASDYNGSDYN